MRRPRLRSALLAGAVLSMGVPALALAEAPALHCRGVKQTGLWESIHIDSFKPVQSLSSSDTVTGYTVDEGKPQDLAVTNGVRVQSSTDHGCDWTDSLALQATPSASQSFAGLQAKVVSLALLGSTHVAAVQEGSGAASRPHIMVGTGSDWVTADSGLPVQGAPKLLRAANDGRTLYLTVSPTNTGGDGGATTGLPGLPVTGGGGGGTPTGLLYASTDRGHSWTLRTTASDLPSGGEGFSALDVDGSDSNRLYGIVNGQLAVSGNGGSTFTRPVGGGFSAVTAMGPLTVGAFTSGGSFLYSSNGGTTFTRYVGPAGVTSAGYRSGGDSSLMLERSGQILRFTPFTTSLVSAPAATEPRTGSMLGDRSDQASFHALSGHSILRYVDVTSSSTTIPPIATGDTSVPPPRPGVVVPAVRAVTLPVGQTATVPFTLDLPKNPTPLDLFFLVDASGSMTDYIKNLKANINRIVSSLTAQKVDLKVGVGTLGSGERKGDQPYPATYVYPTDPKRTYNRPKIYHRIRAVGAIGSDLQKAVDSIQIESDDIPSSVGSVTVGGGHEGQLLALQDLSDGRGIQSQYGGFSVPPGQNAGWRGSQDTRRIVIVATDEAFDNPYPQRTSASGQLDFGPALAALKAKGTQVIGLTAGSSDSAPDLRKVASGTGSFAPPGGVYCGIDPNTDLPENLKQGDPMVCNSGDHFADAIIRLLASLVDRQSVKLVPLTASPVLGAVQGSALTGLNVKKPNAAP
ncbi:MAG: exo-alpha-sialidase, partial [Frankiales bacterium]|nr:exo-alpha-sialidase [Frankiales bacterium]